MITTSRRQLLATTGLLALGGAIPAGCARAAGAGKGLAVGKPNLFIGTGGHGHTFPGASLPFGIPNAPSLVGTQLYAQWATLVTTGPLLGIFDASNALFVSVGG